MRVCLCLCQSLRQTHIDMFFYSPRRIYHVLFSIQMKHVSDEYVGIWSQWMGCLKWIVNIYIPPSVHQLIVVVCLEYDSAHHMSLFVMLPRLSKYKPVPHGDVPHHNNNIYTRHCPEYNGNWRVGGPIIATFSTYNNMFLQVRGRGVGEGSCAFVYAMGRRKRHHKPSETTTAERMRRHLVHILV